MKDILDRIKAECHNSSCKKCKLLYVCEMFESPYSWDTEAIRKALNETVDEPKAEIVVPEKMTCEEADSTYKFSYVINEIISCLEQIKERLE